MIHELIECAAKYFVNERLAEEHSSSMTGSPEVQTLEHHDN